jgi:hypothetical protein
LSRRRASTLLGILAAGLLAAGAADAQVSETAVKAAFIPKFARYVTWPQSAASNGPVAICVIGDDPFGNALDQAAAGQSIDGRPIVIKRLSSASGASVCAIAFVDGSHAGEILAALGRRPILTVTDSRSSTQHGIIHFAVVGGRVRFYIDNARAQACGLTISSRLLALAVGVNQR